MPICNNYIGGFGRLGNQMFQYASLRGIAENRGFSWTLHPSSGHDDKEGHLLFEAFKLTNLHIDQIRPIDPNLLIAEELVFHFNEFLFNNCPDNVSLTGYFQSDLYFKHIKDSIIEDFCFKDHITNKALSILDNIGSRDFVSLHVRRGDFVEKQSYHPLCSLDYYQRAIDIFDKETRFLVFSDDMNWVKSQTFFHSGNYMPITTNNHFVDLCLMTMAYGHIIANSSFSWWGAWLACNSALVVAPSNWFGPSYPHINTKDLYPVEWLIV